MILISGASGLVGGALLACCRRLGLPAEGLARAKTAEVGRPVWSLPEGMAGGVIIHCAAQVEFTRDGGDDPLPAFRRSNVENTLALARLAVAAGVRRFIFVSSIKVNGEQTFGNAFDAFSSARPEDAYAVSKMEAEAGLRLLAAETGMECVIIRPPLVYGPGAKANFFALLRLVDRGFPLPFGAIDNRRSLVALDNLIDLIMTCMDHPKAANQIFTVSDGEDVSTTELLKRMALALGRPSRLFPVPVGLIKLGSALVGRRELANRLCGSLQVDIAHTCDTLGWRPPSTMVQQLKKVAEWMRLRGK